MKLSSFDFIMAAEDGSLTQDDFNDSAQSFVNSCIWRQLQGSWQRTVNDWIENGLVDPPQRS